MALAEAERPATSEQGEHEEVIRSHRKWRLVPGQIDRETAELITLMPYKAYSLALPQKVLERLRLVKERFPTGVADAMEPMINPSFSQTVFLRYFDVDFLGACTETGCAAKRAVVKEAFGFSVVPSPAGEAKYVWRRVENVEVEFENPVAPTEEAAQEIALRALSMATAGVVSAKYLKAGGYERGPKKYMFTVSILPNGDILVIPSKIRTYKCKSHDATLYGALGMAAHHIEEHLGLSEKVADALRRRERVAGKVLGELAGRVSYLNVLRNRFDYVFGPVKGSPDEGYYRYRTWYFKESRVLATLFRREGELVLRIQPLAAQRPARTILHDPLVVDTVLLGPYKEDRHKFLRMMDYVEKTARREGFDADKAAALRDLVTGILAYSSMKPRFLYAPDIGTYVDILETVEDVGGTYVELLPLMITTEKEAGGDG